MLLTHLNVIGMLAIIANSWERKQPTPPASLARRTTPRKEKRRPSHEHTPGSPARPVPNPPPAPTEYLLLTTRPHARGEGWIVKWYAGININCTVEEDFTDFFVRTYGSHRLPSPCVPANGSARGVGCHSDVYDNGEVVSIEGCDRDIGRGSARRFRGGGDGGGSCCRFYSAAQCGGAAYLDVVEGECVNDVVVTGFSCVSLSACFWF